MKNVFLFPFFFLFSFFGCVTIYKKIAACFSNAFPRANNNSICFPKWLHMIQWELLSLNLMRVHVMHARELFHFIYDLHRLPNSSVFSCHSGSRLSFSNKNRLTHKRKWNVNTSIVIFFNAKKKKCTNIYKKKNIIKNRNVFVFQTQDLFLNVTRFTNK